MVILLDIFFWFYLLDTKNIWQAILARFTLCNSHCVGSTDYSLFFYQKAETKIFLGDWDSKAGCEGGRSNYKKRSLSVTPTHYLKSLKIAWCLFQEMSAIISHLICIYTIDLKKTQVTNWKKNQVCRNWNFSKVWSRP